MKIVQSNGNTREISVGGPTMGLNIDVAIIDVDDVYKLLEMNDFRLRDWLSTLTTRFTYKHESSAAIS